MGEVNAVGQRGPVKARSGLPSVGYLSGSVAGLLETVPGEEPQPREVEAVVQPALDAVADPLGDDDLQLALYLCYELHYRSLPGVHGAWEWNPTLLGLRALLETAFFGALEELLEPNAVDLDEVGDLLFRLEAEGEPVHLARYLAEAATLEEYREYVAGASIFRHKTGDLSAWTLPRLTGPPKAELMRVLGAEYGGWEAARPRSDRFADTMRALELDQGENAYLDRVPGETLAGVNAISGFGLHRSRRGAGVGLLAMLQMTSDQRDRRHSAALQRFGLAVQAAAFYDERAEARSERRQIPAYALVEALIGQSPQLAGDVVFGARALIALENRFAHRMLGAWEVGESALR